MQKKLLLIVFIGLLTLDPMLALGETPICKHRDNVVANGLLGKWIFDQALSDRLAQKAIIGKVPSVTFTEDKSVTKLFDGLLDVDCVYLAGHLKAEKTNDPEKELSSPFVLSISRGNPTLWYDERGYKGGGNIRDLHPAIVMLAKGTTDAADILFMGGDHNNQPMYAFSRSND